MVKLIEARRLPLRKSPYILVLRCKLEAEHPHAKKGALFLRRVGPASSSAVLDTVPAGILPRMAGQ